MSEEVELINIDLKNVFFFEDKGFYYDSMKKQFYEMKNRGGIRRKQTKK